MRSTPALIAFSAAAVLALGAAVSTGLAQARPSSQAAKDWGECSLQSLILAMAATNDCWTRSSTLN